MGWRSAESCIMCACRNDTFSKKRKRVIRKWCLDRFEKDEVKFNYLTS